MNVEIKIWQIRENDPQQITHNNKIQIHVTKIKFIILHFVNYSNIYILCCIILCRWTVYASFFIFPFLSSSFINAYQVAFHSEPFHCPYPHDFQQLKRQTQEDHHQTTASLSHATKKETNNKQRKKQQRKKERTRQYLLLAITVVCCISIKILSKYEYCIVFYIYLHRYRSKGK